MAVIGLDRVGVPDLRVLRELSVIGAKATELAVQLSDDGRVAVALRFPIELARILAE